MAKIKKEKDKHFIPSPFKTVTSYENAFIRAFNDNLSEALADVLKYVAKVTSNNIKNLEKDE